MRTEDLEDLSDSNDPEYPPHISELRMHVRRIDDKLRGHIQTCREFADMCKEQAEEDKRIRREETEAYNNRHALHEQNYIQSMEAIRALTGSIAALTDATKGLVEAWTFMSTAQRLVKWLSTFAILSGAVLWVAGKLHITPT